MKSTVLTLVYLLFLIIGITACEKQSNTDVSGLPKVEDLDLTEIDPASFAEDEWYMPYYLKHFSRLANSVLDTGQNIGYIDISVWRSEEVNQPYDARIMENIMSLAWFYTQKRDWNPYYNDPALKARLEAALTFWSNMQNTDGMFSEYAYSQWRLAPTAFATKFVGRALQLLNSEQNIDAEVYNRAVEAWRKALFIGFTDQGLWEHGRNYTNQFANLWGGALMYLDIYPDTEIEQLFKKRLYESITEFQSPCGFFYEKGGPDWGYNLSTHHSDLHVAWEFARDTELQDVFLKKTQDWYDWFSYNAVKEPDNLCYYLNRAIETRQRKGFYLNVEVQDPAYERWTPQAEFVPIARAFEISESEFEESNRKSYQNMRKKYPKVAPLEIGEFRAFSPYAFLHQGMKLWHPTDEQKQDAINELPYIKNQNFIHIRHDNRSNTTYSFIRKPNYYAIFNSGKILSGQQRYGLGLIWNPDIGTFFQSQSASDKACYGTKAGNAENVYEASDLMAELKLNDTPVIPVEGNHDLNTGEYSVVYQLGNNGEKEIQFKDDRISIQVNHSGNFTEIIPLLVSGNDKLSIDKNQIILQRKNLKVKINIDQAKDIESTTENADLNEKKCRVIKINASNNLHYEILTEEN
jgi:hypothetical protein